MRCRLPGRHGCALTRLSPPQRAPACRDGDLGPETLAYAEGVETTLQQLQTTLNSTNPQLFTSASSLEGMLNLASEVVAKKVSSEEETSSDLSQLIFYNNWKGILSQVGPADSAAASAGVRRSVRACATAATRLPVCRRACQPAGAQRLCVLPGWRPAVPTCRPCLSARWHKPSATRLWLPSRTPWSAWTSRPRWESGCRASV